MAFFSLVLLWSTAWADSPAQLNYRAPAGCPDSVAFVDAVAARLGAEPFLEDSGEDIAVRIGASASGAFGTLTIADSSKVIDGATCQEVFDALVVSAAVLLDNEMITAPVPPEPQARISFTAAEEGTVIHRQVAMSTFTDVDRYLIVHEIEPICTAPCQFSLPAGVYTLVAKNDGSHFNAIDTFTFAPGDVDLSSDLKSKWSFYTGASMMLGSVLLTFAQDLLRYELSDPALTAMGVSKAGLAIGGPIFVFGGRSRLRERSTPTQSN